MASECEDDILDRNISHLDRETPRGNVSEEDNVTPAYMPSKTAQSTKSPLSPHKLIKQYPEPPQSHWEGPPMKSQVPPLSVANQPGHIIHNPGEMANRHHGQQLPAMNGSPLMRRNVMMNPPAVGSPSLPMKAGTGARAVTSSSSGGLWPRHAVVSQPVYNKFGHKPVPSSAGPVPHVPVVMHNGGRYDVDAATGGCHCHTCLGHNVSGTDCHAAAASARRHAEDKILLKSRELDLCWQEEEYDCVKDFTGNDRSREISYGKDKIPFGAPARRQMPVTSSWQYREEELIKNYTCVDYGQELGSRIPSSERISLTPPFVESGCETPAPVIEAPEKQPEIESNDRQQPQAVFEQGGSLGHPTQAFGRPRQNLTRQQPPPLPREDYGDADSVKDYSLEPRRQQELSSRIPSYEMLYFTPPWTSENNSGVHTPCLQDPGIRKTNTPPLSTAVVTSIAPPVQSMPCTSCHPAWESAAGDGDMNPLRNKEVMAPDSVRNFSIGHLEQTSRIPSDEQLCLTPPWVEDDEDDDQQASLAPALTLEERRVIDEQTRNVRLTEQEEQARLLREQHARTLGEQVQDVPNASAAGAAGAVVLPGRDSGFCSEQDPQQQQQQQQNLLQQLQPQRQESVVLQQTETEKPSDCTPICAASYPEKSQSSNTAQRAPRPVGTVARKHSWSSRDSGASNHTDISTVVNLPTSVPITAPGSPEPDGSPDDASSVADSAKDSGHVIRTDIRPVGPMPGQTHIPGVHQQYVPQPTYAYPPASYYHNQPPVPYHHATMANCPLPPAQLPLHRQPMYHHPQPTGELYHHPTSQPPTSGYYDGRYGMQRAPGQPEMSPTMGHRGVVHQTSPGYDKMDPYASRFAYNDTAPNDRQLPGTAPMDIRPLQTVDSSNFDRSVSRSSLLPHRESPPVADGVDTASVVSFASASYQNIDSKVDMVSSLLTMLGTHDKDDMASTMVAMSRSPDSCAAMRQSGCISLLVNLIHDPNYEEKGINWKARGLAEEALDNIVHCGAADDRRSRREARILRLLQIVRTHCEAVLIGREKYKPRRGAPPLRQNGPANAVLALMKMAVEKEHKALICEMGGLQALSELISVDCKANSRRLDAYSIGLRKSASMALIELTVNDNHNKAVFCSMRNSLNAVVGQLQWTEEEELVQLTAHILRNVSWKVDDFCKERLTQATCARALMECVQRLSTEVAMRNVLWAVWNLSAHCHENKSQVCSTPGSLQFLCYALNYRCQKGTLVIAESAGGILRNVSSLISKRPDYREILRSQGCLQTLISHLRLPSTRIVSNACGILWNLSARSPKDQEMLWELGAVSVLKTLVNSKHKGISSSSASALRNLLRVKPGSSSTDTESLMSYRRRHTANSSNALPTHEDDRQRTTLSSRRSTAKVGAWRNAFLAGDNGRGGSSGVRRSDSQPSNGPYHNGYSDAAQQAIGYPPPTQREQPRYNNAFLVESAHSIGEAYGGSAPVVGEQPQHDRVWHPTPTTDRVARFQPPAMQHADSFSSSSSLAPSSIAPTRHPNRRQSLPKEQLRRPNPRANGLFKHRRSVSDSFPDFNPAQTTAPPPPCHAETDSELYNYEGRHLAYHTAGRAAAVDKKIPQHQASKPTIIDKRTHRKVAASYNDCMLSLMHDTVARVQQPITATATTLLSGVTADVSPPKATAEMHHVEIRQAIQRRSNDTIADACAAPSTDIIDATTEAPRPNDGSQQLGQSQPPCAVEEKKKQGVFKGRLFGKKKSSSAPKEEQHGAAANGSDAIEMTEHSDTTRTDFDAGKKPLRSSMKQSGGGLRIFRRINAKSKKTEKKEDETTEKRHVVVTSL